MTWDSNRNRDIANAIQQERGSWDSSLSPLGRVVSIAMAVAYVAGSALLGSIGIVLKIAGVLILPLAAIWFSDALAAYVGGEITHPSAGPVVRIAGWILLFTPLLALAFMGFQR